MQIRDALGDYYVLRPTLARERLEPRPDGLVRITLNKVYTGRGKNTPFEVVGAPQHV
jgi:hypothetical protein